VEFVKSWRGFRRNRQVVHRVTDAPVSLTDDIKRRERAYLIKMGIRLICFILAVALPAPWPIKLLLVAAAVLLPYVAVIGANQRGRDVDPDLDLTSPERKEITGSRREIGS
jgi:hypothetical protein